MKHHEIEAMIRDVLRIEESIPHDMMRDATRESQAFLRVRNMMRRSRVVLMNVQRASRDARVSRLNL